MVTLNLTLLIELGLFLIFMWLANKLVIQPTLELLDARKERIANDEETAEHDAAEAERLRGEYASAMNDARRTASRKLNQARQEALSQRARTMAEHHRAGDEAVRAARQKADEAVASQRPEYERLAPALADAIVGQVTREGEAK